MKVGDYVKTRVGYIGEIININEFREPSMKYGIDFQGADDIIFIGDEHIVKSSPNIIDLIEVGDYVNGYLVYEIKENCVMVGYKCFKTEFDNEEDFLYQTIYANDIKSIVTKELFKKMEYKVGD